MFLQGLILGFSTAAPVGPIGLLCIQRTLNHGRLNGFVSGLGAATADTCYGLAAAFGFGAAMQFLLGLQSWLQVIGGIVLVFLGYRIARTVPRTAPTAADPDPQLLHAWASVFALTLANPATVLLFLGAFVALGLDAGTGALTGSLLLVAGVFTGSALWWLALSQLAGLARGLLNPARMRLVNLVAGLVIIALGLGTLVPRLLAARL